MDDTQRVLGKIHDINYIILTAFDEYCKAHGIPYYLDSGTLLGAVRHQDFIPWDDDLDIVMFIEDYKKLKQAMKDDPLPEEYEFIDSEPVNGYFWDFIPRVTLKCSRRHLSSNEDNAYNNFENRLGIDLFLLEGASSKFQSNLKVLVRKILYGLAMGHRYQKRPTDSYSGVQKLQVCVLSGIGRLIPVRLIFWLYKWMGSRSDAMQSTYLVRTNSTVPFLRCIFKSDWFKKTVLLKIRNKEFPAPEGYDEALKALYGDYMTPPPIHEQVPPHGIDGFQVSQQYLDASQE